MFHVRVGEGECLITVRPLFYSVKVVERDSTCKST